MNVRLTAREAWALHSLLAVILTNPDRWEDVELPALARADRKIQEHFVNKEN